MKHLNEEKKKKKIGRIFIDENWASVRHKKLSSPSTGIQRGIFGYSTVSNGMNCAFNGQNFLFT